MCLADAFVAVEQNRRERVFQDTWGHLAPRKNKVYHGRVVFAVGCYGHDHLNPTILVSAFGPLEDSPWLVDALMTFVRDDLQSDVGCVYEWRGTVRNYRFRGQLTCLLDANTPVKEP